MAVFWAIAAFVLAILFFAAPKVIIPALLVAWIVYESFRKDNDKGS